MPTWLPRPRVQGSRRPWRFLLLSVALLVQTTAAAQEARGPSAEARGPAGGAIGLTELPFEKNDESQDLDHRLWSDRSPDGKPLTLGSDTFSNGLMVIHGAQSWSYRLEGKYASLSARIGQSADSGAAVRIFGDGTLLHDSGILPVQSSGVALVNVQAVKILQFVVLDISGENNRFGDVNVVIGNPRLSVEPLPDTPASPAVRKQVRAMPWRAAVNSTVTFDGSAATEEPDASYSWDFGDGHTATGAVAQHKFSTPGRHQAHLMVRGSHGRVHAWQTSVRIVDAGDLDKKPFPLPSDARVLVLGASRMQRTYQSFCLLAQDVGWKKLQTKTVGSWTMDQLGYERTGLRDVLNCGWDVVVVHSGGDVAGHIPADAMLEKTKKITGWIREAGAYPVIFELQQFAGADFLRQETYCHQRSAMLAEKLDLGLVPSSQAWLQVFNEHPLALDAQGKPQDDDPESFHPFLYKRGDNIHGNGTANMFNALLLWRYLTGQSAVEVKLDESRRPGPNPDDAINWAHLAYLRKVVDDHISPASARAR